jgi:hypothetical protein
MAAAAAPAPGPRTRVGDALLVGVAAAGLGAALWWAVSTFSSIEQWHYASALVGLVVGLGVLVGGRRGSPALGLVAALLTTIAVLATVYFIDRSLQVASLDDAGLSSDVPLWQGAQAMVDIVRDWIEFDVASAAGWLLGPVVALVIAGWPGRRAPI